MAEVVKPRDFWFARHSTYIPQIPTPVKNVVVNYTRKEYKRGKESPGPRPTTRQIIEELQYLQRGDTRSLPDIKYNFMIGPDCNMYEGRGWLSAPTMPTKWSPMAFSCYYIAFIGDFTSEEPPKCMFDKLEEWIKYGVRNCFINPKFVLFSLSVPWKYQLTFDKYLPLDKVY